MKRTSWLKRILLTRLTQSFLVLGLIIGGLGGCTFGLTRDRETARSVTANGGTYDAPILPNGTIFGVMGAVAGIIIAGVAQAFFGRQGQPTIANQHGARRSSGIFSLNGELLEQVRQIVLWEWDPIGILGDEALREGEYGHYVPWIASYAFHKAEWEEIFQALWNLETGHMGLQGNRELTESVARKIADLGLSADPHRE